MVTIVLLVIGIVAFVRGQISVTKTRELRGGGLYAVAALFCLPLPLSIVVGLAFGAASASSGQPLDDGRLRVVSLVTTWIPVIAAFILAFALAKPKVVEAGQIGPRGFDVQMPPAPPAGVPSGHAGGTSTV